MAVCGLGGAEERDCDALGNVLLASTPTGDIGSDGEPTAKFEAALTRRGAGFVAEALEDAELVGKCHAGDSGSESNARREQIFGRQQVVDLPHSPG